MFMDLKTSYCFVRLATLPKIDLQIEHNIHKAVSLSLVLQKSQIDSKILMEMQGT